MEKAVIVRAMRTPIGKKGGIFQKVAPEVLAAAVIRELILQCHINPYEIDDVILGNAVGPGGNIARLSLLTAGLPVEVPGVTVDRQCGSGLEAISQAARLIQAGAGEIYLAGGLESTSRQPMKWEQFDRSQEPRIYDRARFSPDEIGDPEMGEAAENVAEQYGVSREEQDRFALLSYQKAIHSMQTGRFKEEIVAIRDISQDEGPRANADYAKLLSRLRPVFKESGTVTAGNSCGLNDGAAVVLMMSESKAKSLGLTPQLTFIDSTAAGVNPNVLGIGPVPAVRKLLARRSLTIEDIDLVEFNEAFASQTIASLRMLNIPWEKVNVGGGAIALGHPYGASGAILVTRLCTEWRNRRKDGNGNGSGYGLATLGIGGGLGLAVLFK